MIYCRKDFNFNEFFGEEYIAKRREMKNIRDFFSFFFVEAVSSFCGIFNIAEIVRLKRITYIFDAAKILSLILTWKFFIYGSISTWKIFL